MVYLFLIKNSGDVTFCCNEMGILSVNLIILILIIILMKMILILLFLSPFLLGIVKFKKQKTRKKELNKELMLVTWYRKRWWNFCVAEDEKKEIEPIFIEPCF